MEADRGSVDDADASAALRPSGAAEAEVRPDSAVGTDAETVTETSDREALPRISSPVLILAGPSPAVSELTQRLRALDVKVLHAPNGETASTLIPREHPQLLVVDARASRKVPRVEEVVRELRDAEADLAVLVWFDAEVDLPTVLGICEPMDDHMASQIQVEESMRRLHLLTARLPERREGERLEVGDLQMDTAARTVRRGGRDIDLSETEFRLLRLLMRHARTVLPKTEILQQVWEYEFAGQANIVELYISYVRKKIEADMPRMIHTVRGAGYVLRPAEGRGAHEVDAADADGSGDDDQGASVTSGAGR